MGGAEGWTGAKFSTGRETDKDDGGSPPSHPGREGKGKRGAGPKSRFIALGPKGASTH